MKHTDRVKRMERAAGGPDAPLTHMALSAPLSRYRELSDNRQAITADDVVKATVGRHAYDAEARELTPGEIASEPWRDFNGVVSIEPDKMSVSDWNEKVARGDL